MLKNITITLEELRERKKDVELAIAAVERLGKVERRGRPSNSEIGQRLEDAWKNRPERRGRKTMGSEERQEVSERMKKYWDGQRAAKKAAKNPPDASAQ